MVTDKKGNIFENRRKKTDDRRKNEIDKSGGRRKIDRRQIPENSDKKK